MFGFVFKNPTMFATYSDWMRLHIFVLFFCCWDSELAYDLIFVNAVGSLFTSHLMYTLTSYELFDVLMEDYLKYVVGYRDGGIFARLALNFFIEGLPVVFAYCVNAVYVYHPRPLPWMWLWLVTALPHAAYCFCLTGSLNWTPLYGVALSDYGLSDLNVLICILSGHFLAYHLLLFSAL
jgi:hypothetical protein